LPAATDSLVAEQGPDAAWRTIRDLSEDLNINLLRAFLADALVELASHRVAWPDIDSIRRAIADPGAVVGRRLGPSWGVGNDSYADQPESVAEWGARAVVAVLTGTSASAGRPVVEVQLPEVIPAEASRG
jgi:hypothetical protein